MRHAGVGDTAERGGHRVVAGVPGSITKSSRATHRQPGDRRPTIGSVLTSQQLRQLAGVEGSQPGPSSQSE
jgi:hypothetical protein